MNHAGMDLLDQVLFILTFVPAIPGDSSFFFNICFYLFLWLCWVLVAACGIYFPDQGSNPRPPALGAWSLSHWTTREVPDSSLKTQTFPQQCSQASILGMEAPPRQDRWVPNNSPKFHEKVNFTVNTLCSHWVKICLMFMWSEVEKWSLNHVWLFATPWTVAYHTPLSMGFSRQEYWSGVPLPSPGDLPNPGIETQSPVP